MQPILRIATNAIREAGRELTARASFSPLSRSSTNEATEYFQRTRRRAFQTINGVLQNSYPDTPILDAQQFHTTDAEMAWVIEPIDGSQNYVHRLDQYCSIVGVYINGKLEHGLIIDHYRDGESVVTKDQGAFSPSARMRVSEIRAINQGLVAGDNAELLSNLQTLGIDQRITGSSMVDLSNTCTARLDCLVMKRVSQFQFDFIRLFVKESGGFASTLSGGEWSKPDDGLVAGNTYVHRHIVRALQSANARVYST